jgi:hypothetical protein
MQMDAMDFKDMSNIAARFGQVFWGLLLVILDLSVNGIDLLPDFIGYALMAVGLRGLTELSTQFAIASTCAWCLVPVTLVAMLPVEQLGPCITVIHVGLDCAMMWALLGGIMDCSTTRNRLDLAERASSRRVAYVGVMCLVTVLGFVAGGIGPQAVILIGLLVVCLLVLLVMILHLIHRVKVELVM